MDDNICNPAPAPRPFEQAPGGSPAAAEFLPITGPMAALEAILRQPSRVVWQVRQPGSTRLTWQMIGVAIVCSLVYGLIVGTFSRGTQIWAAPVKVAGGLLASAVICLPSLYIFMCLSGSRARFSEICGFMAGLLLLLTVLLVGFAPVAWLFSESTHSLLWMGALHLIFWFIATAFGLRFLASGVSDATTRSSAAFHTWVVIFLLVAVQMMTALRPIVGKSSTFLPQTKKFFLVHWVDCARGWDDDVAARRSR